MDDVICGKGFLRLVNSFLNTDYKEEEIKQYYIQDLIPQERRKEYREYFCTQNIYIHQNRKLYPGRSKKSAWMILKLSTMPEAAKLAHCFNYCIPVNGRGCIHRSQKQTLRCATSLPFGRKRMKCKWTGYSGHPDFIGISGIGARVCSPTGK